MLEPRTYRAKIRGDDLLGFALGVGESDVYVRCEKDLYELAKRELLHLREILQDYIKKHPEFAEAMVPIDADEDAPDIIKSMADAGRRACVGPMAAVAGAIADFLGKALLEEACHVIVENGGDIFLASEKDRVIGIYAGSSPLSNKIGIRIKAKNTPCGICTSSGVIGHSLSFGKADAVVVVGESAALADAVATAVCNRIKGREDIENAIEWGLKIPGVRGCLAIVGDCLGASGDIEIVPL